MYVASAQQPMLRRTKEEAVRQTSTGSTRDPTRIMDRDDAYGQSFGSYNITRKLGSVRKLSFYSRAWFHTLVNSRPSRIIIVTLLIYTIIIFLFALLYVLATAIQGDQCFPDLVPPSKGANATEHAHGGYGLHHRLVRATFFSIETLFAIGYSATDITFGECGMMIFLIAFEALAGVTAVAILIGIVSIRIVGTSDRASTIAFSKAAVVRPICGDLYLVIRVAEMRKHQLAQATIRATTFTDTCVYFDDAPPSVAVCSLPTPLIHPDSAQLMLTAIPSYIIHRLDHTSPLLPPPPRRSSLRTTLDNQAAVDAPSETTTSQCPTAADGPLLAAGTRGTHRTHASTASLDSAASTAPPAILTNAMAQSSAVAAALPMAPDKLLDLLREMDSGSVPPFDADLASRMDAVRRYMVSSNAEALFVLEGVDPTSGQTVEARQSYTVSDIRWDATFAPCASRVSGGDVCVHFDRLDWVAPLRCLEGSPSFVAPHDPCLRTTPSSPSHHTTECGPSVAAESRSQSEMDYPIDAIDSPLRLRASVNSELVLGSDYLSSIPRPLHEAHRSLSPRVLDLERATPQR